jgi:hypothetical protein
MNHWASVVVDADARPVLERLAASSSLGNGWHLALVDVWLAEHAGSPNDEAAVVVNIGAHPIGRLLPGDADRYRPAMLAAADRDEAAWTRASLTEISGAMPYRLQIALPMGDG